MPPLRKLDLASMYMNQPVLKAHAISLALEESGLGHMKGTVTLDPNTCSLDLWGDRRGCTKIAPRTCQAEATMMRTLDPHGHHRAHWVLHVQELPDTRVSLIEYPGAGLWYLSIPTEADSVALVPLFEAKLFA